VNVLAEDQHSVADRFAGRLKIEDCDERFAGSDWHTHVTGAPLLANALVALDCTITQMTILDTHAIVIGLVEGATTGTVRSPLLHFDGAFLQRSYPMAAVLASHEPTERSPAALRENDERNIHACIQNCR
jgi:flavin reductase (DIM6/NTAB) family NADH-FMN oxidoreductase RutF